MRSYGNANKLKEKYSVDINVDWTNENNVLSKYDNTWFSDRSKTNEGVGCGVGIWNNYKEKFASLYAEAKIFQAELYGIKMCAENILTDAQNIKDFNENRNIRKKIAICCDSKGALFTSS